jgi:hypothetical protein
MKVERLILVKKPQEYAKNYQKKLLKIGVELSFLSKKDHTSLAEISWWFDSWLQ